MARAYDLIRKEYKCSDEELHNTTLRRLRQIQASIFQRRLLEDRTRRSELSWQTRMLGQIIAYANTETSKEGENKLATIAAGLDMDNPSGAGQEGDDDSTAKNGEPQQGSYERLMGMLGQGMR